MMNQYNDLELMNDILPYSFGKAHAKVFMQGSIPCHTAKRVTQWLKDCEVPNF